MATLVSPAFTTGMRLTRLAAITKLSMTATSSTFVLSNPLSGGQVIWLAYVAFANFSDPTLSTPGTAAPSSFAVSWGTNSTTTPTNMRAATAWGSGVLLPFQIAQQTDTLDPRVYPGQNLYFAITTTTGGLGTMDVGFHGAYLVFP